MKKYKFISHSKEVLDKVICNMCGKEIKKNNFGYIDDYLSIEKKWGFESKFDTETHNIDICQECYIIFINKLKFKPY